MTARKRKKNTSMRGGQTHGWGAKKKHRGKGNKGGCGMAGTGKRNESKKPSIYKEPYFGKRGFIPKNTTETKVINVGELDQKIEKLIKLKKAEQKDKQYIIDLTKEGIDKLLSKGRATKQMIITVNSATEKAIQKVEGAGGQVNLPTAAAEPEAEKPAAKE